MLSFKKKLLPCLLAAVLLLSALPTMALSAEEAVVVSTEEALHAAVEAIPVGGSGEITITAGDQPLFMYLNSGIYVEEKDIIFNLINASVETAPTEYGNGQPVIFGLGANITINADDNSRMRTTAHTGNVGVVGLDNSTDWNEATQSFDKDFTLTINGGTYESSEDVPADHEPDYALCATPGTKVVLNDVICYGPVTEVARPGIGINVPGELVINGGKFSNDVKAYATQGKYVGEHSGFYYVRDKEVSDAFAALFPALTMKLDCVKPANAEDGIAFMVADAFNMEHYPTFDLNPETFSEDFSTCVVTYMSDTAKEEKHTIAVSWADNNAVKQQVDAILENLPKGEDMGGWYAPYIYKVNDLELINYWLTCTEDTDNINALINYSDEFKKYIGYKNFAIDIRMGDGDFFYTFAGGIADFKYKGVTYAATQMEVQADHILYVPDDTANTPEAFLDAAKKRIDAYVGADKVQLAYPRTVFGLLDALHFAETGEHLDPTEDLYTGVDGITADDFCCVATINGLQHHLVIKKGSSKMVTPKYQNVDVQSDVAVSATDASVPLDTTIEVEKLTEGETYDKIIEILDVDKNVTFDISLYSASLGENITKLKNGVFEVKIPVPTEWEGEDLAVYYITADDEVEEHEVTPVTEGNATFAIFETNHFSIYTLAEKKGNANAVAPDGATPQPEELPDVQTGYANVALLWAMLALLSGGAALTSQLRKKHG